MSARDAAMDANVDERDRALDRDRAMDRDRGLERERVDERIVSDRGVPAYAEPDGHRRFSLGATFLGWSVAAFFTVVFLAIAGAVFGTSLVQTGTESVDLGALAIGTLIAYLVCTFAAYVIGGYAAGRIALWDGVKHGLGTVAWAVLFAIVAVVAGSYLGANAGLNTANVPTDMSALTGYAIMAIALTLLAMLAGAALGGAWGERYHMRAHGMEPRRRRVTRTRTRGRPF
ncbi:MAG TPA: hypothetical protein VM370_07650 [Candidatus Thermoplasmatota archaeon]|nr:hypothetical protein [Candidatus Thermoplasmatota archaeon]